MSQIVSVLFKNGKEVDIVCPDAESPMSLINSQYGTITTEDPQGNTICFYTEDITAILYNPKAGSPSKPQQ